MGEHPDWYPDPSNPAQFRYWDGQQWTDNLLPAAVKYEFKRTLLHQKANAAVTENLVSGEPVLVIIRGPSAQAIIGTDRRAFIYKKGFMAGATFGSELTTWNYQHLVGVQIHTGMMSGAVVLQGPGQAGTKTNYWGNSDNDPHKAPNAIPLVRPYEPAQAGVSRLREVLDHYHHSVATPPVAEQQHAAPAVSIADEIRKLAELRHEGLISEAEFDEMRQQLLSRGL